MTSAGACAASAAGVGQRAIHSRQTGSTRATGVCWSITSDTSTAQAATSGPRHGRSRAAVPYQSTIASPVSVVAGLTTDQSAARGQRRAGAVGHRAPVSVPAVLHPVGPLPAAVYWRRRVLVLTLLLSVLGGGGWLTVSMLSEPSTADGAMAAAAATSSRTTAAATPSLEQVVPAVAGVQL